MARLRAMRSVHGLFLAICLPLASGNGGPLLAGHLLSLMDHSCSCPLDGKAHECSCRLCLLARTHAQKPPHPHIASGNEAPELGENEELGDSDYPSALHGDSPSTEPQNSAESSLSAHHCASGAADKESRTASPQSSRAKEAPSPASLAEEPALLEEETDSAREEATQTLSAASCNTHFGDGLLLQLPLVALSGPGEGRLAPSFALQKTPYVLQASEHLPKLPHPPPQRLS